MNNVFSVVVYGMNRKEQGVRHFEPAFTFYNKTDYFFLAYSKQHKFMRVFTDQ